MIVKWNMNSGRPLDEFLTLLIKSDTHTVKINQVISTQYIQDLTDPDEPYVLSEAVIIGTMEKK